MPKRCEKKLCDHIKVVVCKKPQTAKNDFTTTLNLLGAKNRCKKHLIFENYNIMKMAQIGHDICSIAHAKWSVWVKNLKCQKGATSDWATTLNLLCAKNRSKKHLIFEKWQHFENGQNWPRCIFYSPCKMVSLGQKLKMRKGFDKRLYDHIKLVVCKKPLQKTPNIRKLTAFWKGPKLATMHAL